MKLKELCNVTSSKRIFASQYQNSGIPFYRGKEISLLSNNEKIKQELYISEELYQEINEKYGVPKKDDILMTAVGTIGNCYIVKDEKIYFKDGNIIWLKDIDNKKILPKYLYYYLNLNSTKNTIDSLLIGSTQKALTIESFKNIEIDIPNIEIQSKIVKLLNILNNKIRLNTDVNNNLYELIENNYNLLIENCDWNQVGLGTICNISSGKRPVDKLDNGNYPVIGANGVMAYTNGFNFNEDLIITGRVGTLGIIRRYYEKIWASDNTLVIQTKYLNYIENYLKTIDYYSLNRGSTQPLLTQGDLQNQLIKFNEEEVLKFEDNNQIFVDKIRNNEKENQQLSNLIDILLPKLMNGEIDLDNISI